MSYPRVYVTWDSPESYVEHRALHLDVVSIEFDTEAVYLTIEQGNVVSYHLDVLAGIEAVRDDGTILVMTFARM